MVNFNLWTMLAVLVLLHQQGARIVSARGKRNLPPCGSLRWQDPAWDCIDEASPLKFGPDSSLEASQVPAAVSCELQKVGSTDHCRPSSLPKDNIIVPSTAPVTKISWLHCLKCLEIVFTCGCIIGGILIGNPTTPHVNFTTGATLTPPASALNFYNVDTSVAPQFDDVTVVAQRDHDTTPASGEKLKTLRVWKTGSGGSFINSSNVVPVHLSSLTVCNPLTCIDTLHTCWKCLGHDGSPPARAAYNFYARLAPYYDVTVHSTTPNHQLVRFWKAPGYALAVANTGLVGNWRASFTMNNDHLEISIAAGASPSSP